MSILFSNFHEAQRVGDGRLLASALVPANSVSDPTRLWTFSQISNFQSIEADIRYHVIQDRNAHKLAKAEANQWVQILVSLWKSVRELALLDAGKGGDWNIALKSYKDVCVNLCRGYTNSNFPAWSVPCMYTAGKYLRIIAIKADAYAANSVNTNNGYAAGFTDDIADTSEKNDKLQDAARTLQQMISVCRTDDSDLSESRKWGVISIANLLFKTYFKLNNLALTKHVIAMLESPGVNLPPLTAFPMSQRCTFSYYRGVLEFLKENYAGAEQHLSDALSTCHRNAQNNKEQILTYLIPAHMLTNQQLPSHTLLSQSPALQTLFEPLCKAIKQGNLAAFDKALADAEVELVNKRIYLTLERSRDLCMRSLFRKVYLYAGTEPVKNADGNVIGQTRKTRLKIDEFEAAIKVAYRGSIEPMVVDKDEVECFLANMIYKGYMKGYIAREQSTVVLSKKKGDAFPNSGLEKLADP